MRKIKFNYNTDDSKCAEVGNKFFNLVKQQATLVEQKDIEFQDNRVLGMKIQYVLTSDDYKAGRPDCVVHVFTGNEDHQTSVLEASGYYNKKIKEKNPDLHEIFVKLVPTAAPSGEGVSVYDACLPNAFILKGGMDALIKEMATGEKQNFVMQYTEKQLETIEMGGSASAIANYYNQIKKEVKNLKGALDELDDFKEENPDITKAMAGLPTYKVLEYLEKKDHVLIEFKK